MQLYFIRHGQSINNANWDTPNYTESADPWLTEIGKEQAQTLADYLEKNQRDINFTHIYASLMHRAAHTASHTARRLPQIPFAAWIDIHESGGIYGREGELKLKGLPGNPRSFFEEHYPELTLPADLDHTGWWQERPQETVDGSRQRAERVWAELLSLHGDQDGRPEHRVAFVSHGEFFIHLMCAILNLPFRSASHGLKSWFLLNNCSLSRIDVRGENVIVCYFNRTDYLPSHLITG